MLGLPPSTDVRKPIPKDAFFSSRKIKGRDRERFDKQIHSMTIRSLVSPETVNLDCGKHVSAIYVMELQLNVSECDEANLLLLDKLGHKTVYALSYGDRIRIAVVEDIVFQTEWGPSKDLRIGLEGLNLDEVWANIVRRIGVLPTGVPLRGVVSAIKKRRKYDADIAELEKKFNKEKQNHERRRLHSEIQRLKGERDSIPESLDEKEPASKGHPSEAPTGGGTSVMGRVREVDQPPRGFIDPRILEEISLDDGNVLGEENIPPSITGLVVDYLTRWVTGTPLSKAFLIPILGGVAGDKAEEVTDHMCGITGLDDESIECACRTCMYDSYYRAGQAPKVDPFQMFVDHQTCENIRIMVGRSKRFFDIYGPITVSGPEFPGAYTEIVGKGDGDYLTQTTIWDLKVSKYPPTKEQTLQLAMYYIMGKHSSDTHFTTVDRIGIYNPRLNTAYTLKMGDVPKDILRTIETQVIGYSESECIVW